MDRVGREPGSFGLDEPDNRSVGAADLDGYGGKRLERVAGRGEVGRLDGIDEYPERLARHGPVIGALL